jgi:hypothetical protein
VKARRVKGVDPDGPLADEVEKIVAVRVDELFDFVPAVLDPANVVELHDMRIAAKRLRYLLELTHEVFGPYAATAAKRAKELQDLLGEIHDCDVTLPRVQEVLADLRTEAAHELRVRAGDADDLAPALVADAPHAERWRGLEDLAVFLQARRELLYDRFLELWTKLQRDGFRARLEFATSERSQTAVGPAVASDA